MESLDNKDFGMFGCGLLLSRSWLVSEKRCIHVSFPGVVAWDFGVACLPIFHSSTPVVSLVPDLSSFLSAFDRSASVAPTSDPLLQVVSFAAGLKLSKTGGSFRQKLLMSLYSLLARYFPLLFAPLSKNRASSASPVRKNILVSYYILKFGIKKLHLSLLFPTAAGVRQCHISKPRLMMPVQATCRSVEL